jgi:hypothetical protein
MEVVVVYFKALVQNLPGGTEENTNKLCQDNISPGQDSNRRRKQYEGVHYPFDKTETDAGKNES